MMVVRTVAILLALLMPIWPAVYGPALALEVTETPAFPVSPSNVNSFATPIAYYQGSIYVVSVEQPSVGESNGINLQTVIRKGSAQQGCWQWESTVIDAATLDDMYHTQASVAIDKDGYVHVAYNMHNMPWQYVVSKRPGDISSFDFKGDAISLVEKYAVKHLDQTSFPSIGTAAIPGNQITYPAFFYDRQGELYITYRFATRPKKAFGERGFAYALARYDVAAKRWDAMGGAVSVTTDDADLPIGVSEASINALISSEGWQPQLLRLFFDRKNRMHLSWSWREFFVGSPFVRPSYAYSRDNENVFYRADGKRLNLPVSLQESGLLFPDRPNSQLSSPLAHVTAAPKGAPYVVTSEQGKSSEVQRYQCEEDAWSDGESTPSSAQVFEIDDAGTQWAFATGLKVYSRPDGNTNWIKTYEDAGASAFGFIKVLSLREGNRFLVYAQSVDGLTAKVYDIRY